jgi:hypothetical protein
MQTEVGRRDILVRHRGVGSAVKKVTRLGIASGKVLQRVSGLYNREVLQKVLAP